MNKNNHLDGLTIFRFVAAFYVFIFHCNMRYPINAPAWILSFLHNGAIGMTFFFVLSGFVLSWSHRDGIGDGYLMKRVARIYPAYLAMGFFSLPFLSDYPWYKSVTYIMLFVTGTQSWFPSSFSQWHFGGSWSVSTEAFFYLLFPALLGYVKNRPVNYLILSLILSSLILPVASLINEKGTFPLYYTGPIYRLPEFLFGMSLGCFFSTRHTLAMPNKILLSTSIFALVFISPMNNKDWMYNNFITLPATGLIIYALASLKKLKKRLLTSAMIYLGSISYSFYLMQLPIMLFIDKNKSFLAGIHPLLAWLCIGAVNLTMASVCYHGIEGNSLIKKLLRTYRGA